ncbi:hypothetical protein JD82_02671 [Prauserella rugosa]|uniref:Uncharacterized protein n=1 Tax=Prauserella rugosa TaxID=43354 RepID=A0A660CBG8_9PSEU|nr:hypothetical protein JD82_02671 [Prauserella rugosa]
MVKEGPVPGARERITLPADVVGRAGNLPPHCTRHGRPASRRKDFALQSTVRLRGNRLLSGNVLSQADRLAQHGSKVKVTDVKGWPLCPLCVRTRAVWMTLASALLFGGLLAFLGALVVGAFTEGASWLAAVAAIGFVLLPVSALPLSRGAMSRVIGARTSPDGQSVIVDKPSAAFVADLPQPPTG